MVGFRQDFQLQTANRAASGKVIQWQTLTRIQIRVMVLANDLQEFFDV